MRERVGKKSENIFFLKWKNERGKSMIKEEESGAKERGKIVKHV